MFLRWGIRLWLMAELRTFFSKPKKAAQTEPMPMGKEAEVAL